MSLRFDVSVDTREFSNLLERRLNPKFGRWVREALEESGKYLWNSARSRTPVVTGKLRGSIYSKITGTETVIVGSELYYAPYVEYGTSPHLIRPVHARVLSWVSGGVRFFSMLVHHPGTRPQHFLSDTTAAATGAVAQIFAKHLGKR